MRTLARKLVARLLAKSDVTIGGPNAWDIQVRDERFYTRLLTGGSLGLGESYMDGDWDVAQLDALFRRLLRTQVAGSAIARASRAWLDLKSRLVNLQTRRGSRAIVEAHYDLDHRLYDLFLGPRNQYTCCFFHRATSLETAEVEKLEMICNKLGLEAGHRVLDIGCGWGGFARYAAETRGCRVTGISISREQVACARRHAAGLPVDIVEADYRDLPRLFEERCFDRVVIIGMIEHVGYKNYRRLFGIIHRLLKDDGLFLLHTIGNSVDTTVVDPWIEKYIFRNSMAPSMRQLAVAAQGLFVMQDWENYGHYYAPTLAAWQANFEANWERIAAIPAARPFDARFRRMFNYYFLSCKAAFETDQIHLWHLVMSKHDSGFGIYPRVNLLGET